MNASEALTRSFNTILSQLDTLVESSEGDAKIQAEALDLIFKAQFSFLNGQINADIDAYNHLCSQIEPRDAEIAQLEYKLEQARQQSHFASENLRLKAIEFRKSETKIEQITNQLNAYKAEADELRPLKNDNKRLRNQVARNKVSNDSLTAKVTTLEQDKDRMKRENQQMAERVSKMKQLHNVVRQLMLCEGLAPERDIKIDNETFFLYRKPVSSHDAFSFGKEGMQASRAHQYFFQVQSTNGVHRDVIPMEDGSIFVPPAKPFPRALTKAIQEEFTKETLFNPEYTPQFATQALQVLFNDIESILQGAA